MSLSFPDITARSGILTGIAGGLLLACTANAAEIYYQPSISVATNANTNVELSPTGSTFAEGYFADASTLIGIATPTSELTVLPRVLYGYYPTQKDLDRLEAFLSASGRKSWQRDRLTMQAFFDHRIDLNAEQPAAEFNPVTPGIGNTAPGTGRVELGLTRNYLVLDPTYIHQVTPLSSFGVAGEYQGLRYSPNDDSAHIDFNYYQGRVSWQWTLTQRMDATVSAFGSRYQAGNIDAHTTSGGGMFETSYNWSQTLRSSAMVQYQASRFVETFPKTATDTSHPWAAQVTTIYEGPIDSYRIIVGRTVGPSAAGGLYSSDQLRGQYDRDLSRRLHLTAAVRAIHDKTIAGATGGGARNYSNASVRLRWMMTPTFYVSGSYTNVWQKYKTDPSGADTNVVSLEVGYKGLGRQPR